jgi:hypothetical protein
MALAVFVLAGLVAGFAFAIALDRHPAARAYEDPTAARLDSLCFAAIAAVGACLATSWVLALTGLLRAAPLTVASLVVLAASAVWLYRLPRPWLRPVPAMGRWTLATTLVALAPVAAWIAFVLWRGTVLPPYNHDALSYHFPKALLLMKAAGFHAFDVPEARTATWPCNYELLLADSMILSGTDRFTAALSTFSYVVMGLFAARTAAAWWGGGPHVALASAVVATAPIVILHSGLHKNDLLFCALAIGAFSWGARWLAAGCPSSAIRAVFTVLLALGTKLTGAVVFAPVCVLLVLGAVRHRDLARPRWIAVVLASAAGASLLLGCAIYPANLAAVHKPFLSPIEPRGYGAWSNIWQFTAMLVVAPFANKGNDVWNVFRGEWWWWPENDVWTSNFGAIASVLAIALAPCVWRYRRAGALAERAAAGCAALFSYVVTLPIHAVPVGFFNADVRYVAFTLPLVVGGTLCPVLIEAERRAGRAARVAQVVLAAGAAAFGLSTFVAFGLHDAYAPLSYVDWIRGHPTDRAPHVRTNRAALAVDRLAGPYDACAFDLGFDTWVYPAYGRDWTRRVEFLHPAEGDVVIPEDADWVAVDRSWNIFFGHPGFVDMGKWEFFEKGTPTDDDLKVFRQLSRDPRFELVYDDRAQNQAVFRRKPRVAP